LVNCCIVRRRTGAPRIRPTVNHRGSISHCRKLAGGLEGCRKLVRNVPASLQPARRTPYCSCTSSRYVYPCRPSS
jgi:hypothetical protein